jgi:CBS domain-containing protein
MQMKAADVMSAPVYIVAPNETVAHARNLMVKHRISRLLVLEDDRLVGIITKKDLAYRLRQSEPAWRRRPLDRIPVNVLMMPDPVIVKPETGIREIASLFIDKNISSVPVVDGMTVVGIVTKTDLMKSALFHSLRLTVRDVMEDVATVSRYHSLDHVIDVMSERNDKIVVVNNDGTLAGIITETNLVFLEPDSGRPGSETKDVKFLRKEEHAGAKVCRYVFEASVIAEDVMSHPVVTVEPQVPLPQAIAMMEKHHINSLVVVQSDDIRGIVKRDDIIREVAK